MKNVSPLTIMGTLAALSVGVAISMRPASMLGAREARPAPAKQKTMSAPAPAFQLGEIVAIQASTALPLAVSPVAAATAERLEMANDIEGISELIRARLVHYSKATGHVRILGFHADPEETRRLGCTTEWIQVRRVDGPNAGLAGWVAATALRRGK